MASSQEPTTMENLPNCVLSDIFIRLLAKQLAQMRCVSKPWNAFLSHSSFIKSHLQRSIRNNDDILLFFYTDFSFHGGRSFTARSSRSPHLELTDFIKPPINLQSRNTDGNVVGSVNGLICFTYGTIDEITYYIWNPSLSAVLTLPPSSFPSHGYDVIGIPTRFGYDPKEDDYKVVKITKNPDPLKPDFPDFPSCRRVVIDTDPNTVYKVEVYSMRKGFWKLLPQSFPSHVKMSMYMNYTEFCVDGLDGRVHWFSDANTLMNSKVIVAFDLGEETFSVMPLPDVPKRYYYEHILGVVGGKLCLMLCATAGECEVWVMEEYGVAESWVKQLVYSELSDSVIIPYGFTLHNEFLFEDANYYVDESIDFDCSFSLYDPNAAKTKCFKTCHGVSKVVEYVDSLVWVAPVEREMNCCSFSRLEI